MTYTMQIKDEITSSRLNEIENRNLFLGYLYTNGKTKNHKITISLENHTIAEKLFKTLKYCYHCEPKITIRTLKKFHIKEYYIFEINDQKDSFQKELKNLDLFDQESLGSFIKGVFLATGSINDPKKNQYHLEMTFQDESKCDKILNLLNTQNYHFKKLKREKNYMLYLKSSEEISDFIKLLGAVNALFYYEDIRIYKDHANMVNRLNNCEQANYEKSLQTSDKQLKEIKYIFDNDYVTLLDDKTKEVAKYRLKYPEESYQALAEIISEELEKKVSKSYINHHFRKIHEIYDKILSSQNR